MTFLEGEKNNRMKKHRIGGGGGTMTSPLIYMHGVGRLSARGLQNFGPWSPRPEPPHVGFTFPGLAYPHPFLTAYHVSDRAPAAPLRLR